MKVLYLVQSDTDRHIFPALNNLSILSIVQNLKVKVAVTQVLDLSLRDPGIEDGGAGAHKDRIDQVAAVIQNQRVDIENPTLFAWDDAEF